MKIKAKSKHHAVMAVLNFETGTVDIHQVDLNANEYESEDDIDKMQEYFDKLDEASNAYWLGSQERGKPLEIKGV